MKRALSNAVTALLRNLPPAFQAILLRKAIAISDEQVKFQNGLVTMFGSIANLSSAGFCPGSIIDVGANVGDWSRSAGAIFPKAAVRMIEAQNELSDELAVTAKDLGERASYEIALLGAEAAEAMTFHLIGTGSSVMEEVTHLDKEVVTLSQKRLDDLDLIKCLAPPILLKLDVQGYELEVLKGSNEILRETEVVLMEVALLPYNKGAPLMPEVVTFMNEQGFTPYDICGQLRRVSDRALFQIDVIFVRKHSSLRQHQRFSMFEPAEAYALGC